jgi:hypothetical protein
MGGSRRFELIFVIAPAANPGSGDVKSTNILKLSCSLGESSFIVNVIYQACVTVNLVHAVGNHVLRRDLSHLGTAFETDYFIVLD